MTKRRINNGSFLGIWCSIAGVCLTFAVALEFAGDNGSFRTFFDTYLGRGAPYVVQAEGSENWDTNYYDQLFPTSVDDFASRPAYQNARKTAKAIADEGIVLLKNKDACLPLTLGSSVTLLGKGAVDPVYSGVRLESGLTEGFISPAKGLSDAGLHVDLESLEFYEAKAPTYPRFRPLENDYDRTAFFVGEIPPSVLDFPVREENAGIVFLSRSAAEGVDLSTDLMRDTKTSASLEAINQSIYTRSEFERYEEGQHQLELSKEEKDLIDWTATHYAQTIVVLNTTCPMEIQSLEDDARIGAVLQVGLPGEIGFASLGNVLVGKTNPSGKTTDIYPSDFSLDPTFANFGLEGNPKYDGLIPFSIDSGINGQDSYFVQYEEGIYTGYRYYETRGLTESEEWYQNAVTYPFGHGLSYTTFSKDIQQTSSRDGEVYIDVAVQNTGAVAGKEVVQLYVETPYVPGGIEKSARSLIAYQKTPLLSPGERCVLRFHITLEDCASYDYRSGGRWILDAGDYRFSIQENSHEISQNETNAPLVFSVNLPESIDLARRGNDRTPTENLFGDVSDMFRDSPEEGRALNMTRADFEGSFPTASKPADASADKVQLLGKTIAERLKRYAYEEIKTGLASPTMDVPSGLMASSLRGADYDDEAFDRLLDQLTKWDYANADAYICNNAYAIKGVESIGLSDADIREGIQGFFGAALSENVCLYPGPTVLAATFSDELAMAMGKAMGEEALAMQHRAIGWYGPSLDLHRSPFSGGYWKNYSEDPILTGRLGLSLVNGAAQKGLMSFCGHLGLEQQESFKQSHLCVYANEQAIRELYLRPLEIVVKEAKTEISYTGLAGSRHTRTIASSAGILTSSTYFGATWSGGRADLITDLLRKQWGFTGVVSTDRNQVSFMNPMQALLAGTDIEFAWSSFKGQSLQDLQNPYVQGQVRRAIKNIAYFASNSNAMQYVAPGSRVHYAISPWRVVFYVGEGVFLLGAIGAGLWIWIRMKRIKRESALEEYDKLESDLEEQE